MSGLADVCNSPGPQTAKGTPWLIRRICTSNPFYVVSAGLFLAGLWVSFGDLDNIDNIWRLMAGMAGYTLLLAVTACFLVRFCNVWEDVRTVLLLVMLMFLATSVTFDMILAMRSDEGIAFYVWGLLFALAVTEGILRGIRLRLPALYRIPFYLILALFFLYPVALNRLLAQPESEPMLWGLFGFSAVAGLVFLTLLPAIRRGPDYLRNNGSPWPWPLYPWVLFGMLACAVPARAFLLCWSMHFLDPYEQQLVFGPYFLIPFGLAVAILLLEIGLVARQRIVIGIALVAPLGLIVLTLVGHRSDKIYAEFLDVFTDRLGGDPLYVTVLALVGYYAYAAVRQVALAADVLSIVLAFLAVVGPDSLDTGMLIAPQPLVVAAIAGLQLILGIAGHNPLRYLLGGSCLAAAAALAYPNGSDADLVRASIAFHLLLTTVLTVGAAFNGAVARLLRNVGALLALLACLVILFLPLNLPRGVPGWMVLAYPPVMAAILALYGLLVRHGPSMSLAGLVLFFWGIVAGWRGYNAVRKDIKGLDYIALSLTVFALAILTTLAKAGLLLQLCHRGRALLAGIWRHPTAEISKR